MNSLLVRIIALLGRSSVRTRHSAALEQLRALAWRDALTMAYAERFRSWAVAFVAAIFLARRVRPAPASGPSRASRGALAFRADFSLSQACRKGYRYMRRLAWHLVSYTAAHDRRQLCHLVNASLSGPFRRPDSPTTAEGDRRALLIFWDKG